MKTHIVIDGNAFYEVDEECMKRKKGEHGTKDRNVRKETTDKENNKVQKDK